MANIARTLKKELEGINAEKHMKALYAEELKKSGQPDAMIGWLAWLAGLIIIISLVYLLKGITR